MKRFIYLRFFIDLLLIPLIIVCAYALKFKLGWVAESMFSISIGTVYQKSQIEPYLTVAWLIVLVWMFTFYVSGFYQKFSGLMPEIEEAVCIVKGVSLATLEIMALTFVYKSFPGSRYVIGYCWILGIFFILFSRGIIYFLEQRARRQGKGLKRTLIVGSDEIGQDVIERILLSPSLGYFYAGTCCDSEPDYQYFHLRETFKILGPVSALWTLIEAHRIEAVFVTQSIAQRELTRLSKFCEEKKIQLKVFVQSPTMRGLTHFEDFDGISFESTRFLPSFRLSALWKRLFDFLFSLCLLLLLFPLFLSIGLFIKFVSPSGPIFYVQERVGQHQKRFGMIKFRTMIPDAEKHTGPVMVSETAETRYIKGGDFLRKTSLDELPQLINILTGQMSLVGPRPERPYFVTEFSKTIPTFPLRHLVPVGLTGWAQINGRSVLTQNPHHKLRYDLYYIKNWSLIFDIKILIKTFFVVLRREEAY